MAHIAGNKTIRATLGIIGRGELGDPKDASTLQ